MWVGEHLGSAAISCVSDRLPHRQISTRGYLKDLSPEHELRWVPDADWVPHAWRRRGSAFRRTDAPARSAAPGWSWFCCASACSATAPVVAADAGAASSEDFRGSAPSSPQLQHQQDQGIIHWKLLLIISIQEHQYGSNHAFPTSFWWWYQVTSGELKLVEDIYVFFLLMDDLQYLIFRYLVLYLWHKETSLNFLFCI